MIFEDLQENYTKVLYSKKTPVEVVEVPKSERSHEIRKLIIRTGLAVAIPFVTMNLVGFDVAFAADNSLGAEAERLYYGEFLTIAKWAIILKGGWDTVAKALREDFEGAKKAFISYALVFTVLLGLPYALNKIENFFRGGI